jgi:hypothetical protein
MALLLLGALPASCTPGDSRPVGAPTSATIAATNPGPRAPDQRAALAEQARKREQLLAAQGIGILSKYPVTGTGAMLQDIADDGVEKVQIFRLDWYTRVVDMTRKDLARREYTTPALELGDSERSRQLKGLLKLVRDAARISDGTKGPSSATHVLVVTPVKGEPFEIFYGSQLEADSFGGLQSSQLKHALWALGGGEIRVSIIHIVDGKVEQTVNQALPAPHQGGAWSRPLYAEVRLTAEKGLTLYARIGSREAPTMEDDRPARFGQASVYGSSGGGQWVVLLNKP